MNNLNILIVDDEKDVWDSFDLIFDSKPSYKLYFSLNAKDTINIISNYNIDLIFLDLNLPDKNGLDLILDIKNIDNSIDIVMITADDSLKVAVKAIKSGAIDYITKPFDVDEIELITSRIHNERNNKIELNYYKNELLSKNFNIVGKSEVISKVRKLIEKVINVDSNVLISGESGTGKELVAKAIHFGSTRKDNPFVAINCCAIPDLLLESELFGHEKGAFTGAIDKKIGKFEYAGYGTIFLDEISNMPEILQAKLLRVLQEREIERVGGNKTIKINARILAATNTNISDLINDGKFREDLYHRLNVIHIKVPPLRERKDDIKMLAEYFLDVFSRKYNMSNLQISSEVISVFEKYHWPGNVRELSNLIERMVILSEDKILSESLVPLELTLNMTSKAIDDGCMNQFLLSSGKNQFEKELILRVLKKVNYVKKDAAKLLGVHRNTLTSKLQYFDIDCDKLKNNAK